MLLVIQHGLIMLLTFSGRLNNSMQSDIKSYKLITLALSAFFLFCSNANSQTNQWGRTIFGASLSISLTNQMLELDSTADLKCVTKNFSTNNVCFVRTD